MTPTSMPPKHPRPAARMASTPVQACSRCHEKKIRCTGYPGCRKCSQVQVQCEPHTRPRRADNLRALKEAQMRVQWLETELSRKTGVVCTTIPTGTSLQALCPRQDDTETSPATSCCQRGSTSASAGGPSLAAASPSYTSARNDDNGSEIGLLALNATGEQRYLGPSSGALFANVAIALVRSSGLTQNALRGRPGHPVVNNETLTGSPDEPHPLSPDEVRLLLQSYKIWVHPLYPLFDLDWLDGLVARCSRPTASSDDQSQGRDMGLFYLVMALGAIHRANTIKQLQLDPFHSNLSDKAVPPAYLYSMASRYFHLHLEQLRPSIWFIQIILLICIYTFYGPIGSSQWQLAGLAMRTAIEIGLHYAPKDGQAADRDMAERSRVFWTAYSIEISLAYNLGRPPSIGEEHITARLPIANSRDLSFGLHHIKHRRIQSRIVSQVYNARSRDREVSLQERQSFIANLQAELDEWRRELHDICPRDAHAPYPHSYWDRLYHGTTFVLHRASPLCPRPSDESLECCIQSAGAYVEDMTEVLRTSNVPLSWMLVQGVLFAGLTMLVTARTCCHRLAARTGVRFFLVDLPAWSRKCLVCLAIMNERWNEDLLSKLDRQFELLADDTLEVISTQLTSPGASSRVGCRDQTPTTSSRLNQGLASAVPPSAGVAADPGGNVMIDHFGMDASTFHDADMGESWESFDFFREVLGNDSTQTFLDILGPQTDYSVHGQRMLLA